MLKIGKWTSSKRNGCRCTLVTLWPNALLIMDAAGNMSGAIRRDTSCDLTGFYYQLSYWRLNSSRCLDYHLCQGPDSSSGRIKHQWQSLNQAQLLSFAYSWWKGSPPHPLEWSGPIHVCLSFKFTKKAASLTEPVQIIAALKENLWIDGKKFPFFVSFFVVIPIKFSPMNFTLLYQMMHRPAFIKWFIAAVSCCCMKVLFLIYHFLFFSWL